MNFFGSHTLSVITTHNFNVQKFLIFKRVNFRKLKKIEKHLNLPLSQKQLGKERSGRKFWITHIVSDHNSKISKFPKISNVSETVRERAKRTQIWGYTHSQ